MTSSGSKSHDLRLIRDFINRLKRPSTRLTIDGRDRTRYEAANMERALARLEARLRANRRDYANVLRDVTSEDLS